MPDENLDVFLSSDQKEFEKERKRLSRIICEIPFCSCVPLEDRGADTKNAIDASLKAARSCDIYVGIFGETYSETTIEEYNEAVKNHKSCLCYVKKTDKRDPKLKRFIETDLRNRFKYHEFKGKTDLYRQVESDIKKLVFETLKDGLEFRKREQEKVIKLIVAEKKAKAVINKEDPLADAQIAFDNDRYLESLVKTTIVLEKALKDKLEEKTPVKRLTLGQLLRLGDKYGVIDKHQIGILLEISYIRNAAVHGMQTPSKEEISYALYNARKALQHLNIDRTEK